MKKRPRSLDNLSPKQEAALWPMVTAACDAAAQLGYCEPTTAAKTAWRHQYLEKACSIHSLKAIKSSGPMFARVMAALQLVAGDGIGWIIKAEAAKPAELLWHVRAMLKGMGIAEDYARGIARNACKLRGKDLPLLDDLAPEQLERVMKIIYGQGARIWHAQYRNKEEPF